MLKVNLHHIAGELKLAEGLSLYMYKDTLGNDTIGWGHLMTRPIPRRAAEIILQQDIIDALSEVQKLVTSKGFIWETLPAEVQKVLILMSFQLGYFKLKGFKKMWKAIGHRNWRNMRVEMLDSKWAREDTPDRAQLTATYLDRLIGEDNNG